MEQIAAILQLVVIGVVVGSVISIGSMGLTLAYGITRFANVAHGDYMTLGMFTAYVVIVDTQWMTAPLAPFSFGWSLIVGFIIAALVVGLLAAALDFLVFNRLRRRGSVAIISLVASIGVALMLRAFIQGRWGVLPLQYNSEINRAIEFSYGTAVYQVIKIKPDQFFIIGVMLFSVVALYLLLYRTRLGTAMRATSDNPALAEISGINTDQVRRVMWMISGSLAGVAGVMLALQSQLKHNAGFEFLLPLFSAVILGGIGNPWGALLGGMIVGVSQEVSTFWLPSGLKQAVPFIVLTLALLLRPRGIFAAKI